MQFESKLNGLHSLHRDLQAKYDRAVQDIYNLDNLKTIYWEQLTKQKEELQVLKACKVENDARIGFQEEKLKSLDVENE